MTCDNGRDDPRYDGSSSLIARTNSNAERSVALLGDHVIYLLGRTAQADTSDGVGRRSYLGRAA